MVIQREQTLFGDVVGHDQVFDQLARALTRGTVPHALLLSGPEGTGKLCLARALAGEIILRRARSEANRPPAHSSSEPEPAATGPLAEQIRLLRLGNHPDLHLLARDPEKRDITVEGVREVCSSLRLKPYYGHASVTIINDAHELNIAACNALLLTLEEPPPHSSFILVTHAPQKLPATILSRCQTIYCGTLTHLQLDQILARTAPELTSSDRENLLTLCDGSLAPLGLSPFLGVSPRASGKGGNQAADRPTSRAKEPANEMLEHLRKLTGEVTRIRAALLGYFSLDRSATPTHLQALTVAAHLAAAYEEEESATWRLIHGVLRDNLRRDPAGNRGRWADLLLESLASERLVRERNVNPILQLSHLCLQHLS